MNIMVFNVAAESGGALSILEDFYAETCECADGGINWIFVLSKPTFKETDSVKILKYPWIKNSWWHRLYFDHVVAPRLAAKYKVDKILSLQNTIIPHTKITQVVYVHQPLPFIDHRFSFGENKLFWVYQNIIGKNILKSIIKAHKVIVQTEWMKKSCLSLTAVKSEKIKVVSPQISLYNKAHFKAYFEPNANSMSTFFYPASALSYKNHKLVVEACKKLKQVELNNYRIVFTLSGDENDHIAELYREVKAHQLPIEFVGNMQRDHVFSMYAKSILLFPSYIETFGMPILEAKLHQAMILASDSPFSHEILDGYSNAYFFNPFDSIELARLLAKMLNKQITYQQYRESTNLVQNHTNSITEIVLN